VVPGIFLVDAGLHVLARSRVADLVVRVAGADPGSEVQAALRLTLGDPGLEVRYWSPEDAGYLDAAGRPTELPTDGDRLLVPVTDRLGTPLAVVLTDRNLQRRPDLVDAAVGAGRMALENARLHATVLAQLAAVRDSRQRLVEAALAERRQVERNLHDGAQQRLLALTMTLGRARATADPDTRAVIDEGREQLRTALAELRELARGIHPAVLTQAGLAAAVESLADGLPTPVTIDVPARRWAPAVEATAYFIVAEGLANAARHAAGAAIRIRVRQTDGTLTVEVADDGPGPVVAGGAGSVAAGGPGLVAAGGAGSVAAGGPGTGLAGLGDRVGALGGTLSLRPGPDGGARLVGRIPCE
jgi:signal transduction histidine kinase